MQPGHSDTQTLEKNPGARDTQTLRRSRAEPHPGTLRHSKGSSAFLEKQFECLSVPGRPSRGLIFECLSV